MLYSGTGDVAESGGSDDDGLCISQVWSMDSDPKVFVIAFPLLHGDTFSISGIKVLLMNNLVRPIR